MKIFLLVMLAVLLMSCGVQEVVNDPPSTYTLSQNYPNPFTDSTRIDYGVPAAGQGVAGPYLRLIVYDRFQQRQAVLMEKSNHPAGTFSLLWSGIGYNAAKVPPGLYYIELQQINTTAGNNQNEDGLIVLHRKVALKQ